MLPGNNKLFSILQRKFKKDHSETKINLPEADNELEIWAGKLADKTGVSVEEAQKECRYAEVNYGISPKKYVIKKYYTLSETAMLNKYHKDLRKETAENEMFGIIKDLSGKSKKTVRAEIRAIKSLEPGLVIGPIWYISNGIYMYDLDTDADKIAEILKLSLKKNECKEALRAAFEKIDRGELSYEDIESELADYRRMTEETMSEGQKIYVKRKAHKLFANVADENTDRILIDIEMTDKLLGFLPAEYIAFDFLHKDIPERRKYISARHRWKIIQKLNTEEGRELLDSKYDAYLRLKPLYKREVILLDKENGYEEFLQFCKRHEVFIKKDNNESLGRAVQKIDLRDKTPLKTVYEELKDCPGRVVLEELICPAPEIAKLNPDSVNTVRIVVYSGPEGASVQDTFMKIGRKGSIVDNGGAGGIFVHVDKKTGIFDSPGIDEECITYVTHPDHNYRFEGYQLPDWESAVKTAIAASDMVPEAKYIGWDLTFTDKREWIIVEGNSKTQFFAQQMTIGRGIKKEFLDAVGGGYIVEDDENADEE